MELSFIFIIMFVGSLLLALHSMRGHHSTTAHEAGHSAHKAHLHHNNTPLPHAHAEHHKTAKKQGSIVFFKKKTEHYSN